MNKVIICGVDTSTLPKLKKGESVELLKRIKAGDLEAKTEFIKGNIRLVLSLIKRFKNTKVSEDDMFQAGCIGLIKATDNFDLSVGVMFSTYAVPMISGEIKRLIRGANSLRWRVISTSLPPASRGSRHISLGVRAPQSQKSNAPSPRM